MKRTFISFLPLSVADTFILLGVVRGNGISSSERRIESKLGAVVLTVVFMSLCDMVGIVCMVLRLLYCQETENPQGDFG